jgi:peptidoglycan/LPS O-acetylase OafA/YrhL
MGNQARGLDRDRQYFGFADGLRALAMLAVVGYEIVRILPPAGVRPEFLRAGQSGANAVSLFFVISGFVLAYPLLSQLYHRGRADLDPAVYALKRILRIFPAYLVVLALLVLVPLAGQFYGIQAVAGNAPGLDRVLAQAIFAGNGLGNDGVWTLAVTARWYVLFPLLIVLWTRAPAAFVGIALIAASTDALLPVAHAWAIGAFFPFMLGIVAAEALVREHRLGRYALLLALAAGAAGFALDPFLATLPGPSGAPVPFPENPFWALAFAALVLGVGSVPLLEQAVEIPPARFLGKIAYAVSLTAVPVVAFAARQLASSRPASVALNGFALTMLCGFGLWQVVDRWFADPKLLSKAGRQLGSYLDLYGGRSPNNRVRLLAEGASSSRASRDSVGTMSRPSEIPGALMERAVERQSAIVTMRTGSHSDLAAEIHETRRRLAEHAASYFTSEGTARLGGSKPDHSEAIRLERVSAEDAEEADPLAAALGRGVKISVRSRKKPK